MATITAALVKELRDATNVSMMECKRALTETEGNIDGAMKLLRERGMAVAAKRASKEANEGLIASAVSADGKTLSLVQVNCETDFVARNESFQSFVAEVAEKALNTDDDLGEAMKDTLMDKIAAIGENLKIRRQVRFQQDGTGKIAPYIHLGGKVGVLIDVACEKPETVDAPAFNELVRDLTLHVAACNPSALIPEDLPAADVQAEREIFARQVADKPPQIIDKIVEGKMRKYFAEVCLVEQGFVKEPKQSIKDLLTETGKAVNDTLSIRRYIRFQMGT